MNDLFPTLRIMPPSPRPPGTAVRLAGMWPNVGSEAVNSPQDCTGGTNDTSGEEDTCDFYSVCREQAIISSRCPSMMSTLSGTSYSESPKTVQTTVPTTPHGTEKMLEDSQPDSVPMTIAKRWSIQTEQLGELQLHEIKRACDDPLAAQGSLNAKTTLQVSSAEKKVDANSKIFLLPITESHIHRISKELVKQWKELSHELCLSGDEIERIDADYRGILEKPYRALLLWRRTEASKATVGRLMTALENVERRDVSDILNEVIAADVTFSPHNGSDQPVYHPKQSMLDIFSHKLKLQDDVQSEIKRDVNTQSEEDEKEEEHQEEQQNDTRESSDVFSRNVMTLDGTLEMLHQVLKKLARTEGQHQFIDEIKSLLVVQDSYEEKLRESMTTSRALRRRDSVIVEELIAHQDIRMQQSQQIEKLVLEIEKKPEEKCKKCKVCENCKKRRARSNTVPSGSVDRPKLAGVKERKTRSAFYPEQEYPGH